MLPVDHIKEMQANPFYIWEKLEMIGYKHKQIPKVNQNV